MKKKQKQKKGDFWKKLKFKYKLSFINETTYAEVFKIRMSRLSGLIILVGFAFFLIALTSVVIIKTPIRNYLPGYLDSEVRNIMMVNALKADSLESKMQIQSQYLANVSAILKGEIEVDKIVSPDSLLDGTSVNLDKSEETEEFIRNYEGEERYNLSLVSNISDIPENVTFHRPLRGVISSSFDLQKKHYGIDIAASPKTPVQSTLKGTVIFTGFDANAGYVIQIQHNNSFVSIYKHNDMLLKKQGDDVSAGEAIALVGNTGNLSTGDHLHFELWFRGKPVNPLEYINF